MNYKGAQGLEFGGGNVSLDPAVAARKFLRVFSKSVMLLTSCHALSRISSRLRNRVH